MSDISETTELGDGYDRADEAVRDRVDKREDAIVHGVHDDHPGDHWTDLQFVYLAIALAVITAVEVALSYMVDDLGPLFLPALIILMLVKFFSVVLYFMHLKFDSRLFGLMFYLGLGLAVVVYLVMLFTFKFFY
jgi:cytochrome c oxidase subunit 4